MGPTSSASIIPPGSTPSCSRRSGRTRTVGSSSSALASRTWAAVYAIGLITWTGRGVPFQPKAQDVMDATRRAVAVLKSGACLAIAGEGRLSDYEGRILPLETGLAHFSRLAHAPIVPTAIIGTRWVHFGSSDRHPHRRTGRCCAISPRTRLARSHDDPRRRSGFQGLLDGVPERRRRVGSGARYRKPSTTAPGSTTPNGRAASAHGASDESATTKVRGVIFHGIGRARHDRGAPTRCARAGRGDRAHVGLGCLSQRPACGRR